MHSRSLRLYRSGLGPARLRRVKEFVYAKMEDELRLSELAQSVGLSTAHFSEMSLLALIDRGLAVVRKLPPYFVEACLNDQSEGTVNCDR